MKTVSQSIATPALKSPVTPGCISEIGVWDPTRGNPQNTGFSATLLPGRFASITPGYSRECVTKYKGSGYGNKLEQIGRQTQCRRGSSNPQPGVLLQNNGLKKAKTVAKHWILLQRIIVIIPTLPIIVHTKNTVTTGRSELVESIEKTKCPTTKVIIYESDAAI